MKTHIRTDAVAHSAIGNFDIEEQREKLFNSFVLSLLAFSGLANLPAILVGLESGFRPGHWMGLLCFIVYALLFLFREKTSIRSRANAFLIVTYSLQLTSLLTLGVLSSFHGLTILLIASAFVFLGEKEAVLQLLLCLAAYIAMLSQVRADFSLQDASYSIGLTSVAGKAHYFFVTAAIAAISSYLILQHVRILSRFVGDNLRLAEQNDALIQGISEAPDLFALWTGDGKLLFCTEQYSRQLESIGIDDPTGISYEEVLKSMREAGSYDRSPGEVEKWQALRLQDFYSGDAEREYRMASGVWRRSKDKKTSGGLIASFRTDITDLKQAEHQLRAIMDSASERIISTDQFGNILFANSGVESSFGYDVTDIVGVSVYDLFDEVFGQSLRDFLASGREEHAGKFDFLENVAAVRKDGSTFGVSVRSILTRGTGGKQLLLVIYDYAALSSSEQRSKQLREAIRKVDVGLVLVGPAHEIVFSNDYFVELFHGHVQPSEGMHISEISRKLMRSGFWGDLPKPRVVTELNRAYADGGTVEELPTADGRYLQAKFWPLHDGSRIGMLIDETDHLTVKHELVQSAKLASLGEMAAGIAHEINQPLNVIKLAATNLLRANDGAALDSQLIERKLARVTEQVDRASEIVNQMRLFGREAKEEHASADSNTCILHAVGMMEADCRLNNIEVIVDVPEQGSLLAIHPIKLEQVLVVLLSNAKDALVETREVANGRRVHLSALPESNGTFGISVSDNAGGVPGDIIDRIMDPFFTTKSPGQGTGLGLSIANRIVSDANGKLLVKNIGAGARFVIKLPLAESK